jgi:putative two-component system response regulator
VRVVKFVHETDSVMLTAQQAIRVMRILVVDDDASSRDVIVGRLVDEGYERVTAVTTGEAALQFLSKSLAQREPVDIALLSLSLTDRPGIDMFMEIHNLFDIATFLLVNREERHLALEGLGHGADDHMLRPVNPELALLKIEKLLTRRFLQKELRRSTSRNETLFLNVLAVMAKVLEAKDPYSHFHSQRVSELASQTAREMGFQDDEVRRIGVAGILHDLGKMGIRESILKKQGPLEPMEREVIERHPIIASTILEPIEQLQSAVSYIRHHHEHFDGSGYPDRLSGEQIPLGARIIHAAEAYDAMVSRRGYNLPKAPEEALSELRSCSGTQFDPQVVEALCTVVRRSGRMSATEDGPARSLPEILEDLTGTVSL